MNRKEFIKGLALGIASVAVSSLIPSCKSPDVTTANNSDSRNIIQPASSELENALTENPLVRELRQFIGKYAYGQMNLLGDNNEIFYNEHYRQMLFTDFYRHDQLPATGTCTELMGTAFTEIKSRYPTYYVTRARGYEPCYFNDSFSSHYFLLLSDKELIGKNDSTEDMTKIGNALSSDPLLIDPSFKVVTSYSSSGYAAHQLYGEEYPIRFGNMLFINEIDYFMGISYPLYLTGQNELMHLMPDFESSALFSLGFQRKKEAVEFYDMEERVLRERAKLDPKALEFVKFFRRKKIIMTDEDLASTSFFLR